MIFFNLMMNFYRQYTSHGNSYSVQPLSAANPAFLNTHVFNRLPVIPGPCFVSEPLAQKRRVLEVPCLELEAAEKKESVFDDDSPPMMKEQLVQFKRQP